MITSSFLKVTPAKIVLPDWSSYLPSTASQRMSFDQRLLLDGKRDNYAWTSQNQIDHTAYPF
jgi:hypothetical protein